MAQEETFHSTRKPKPDLQALAGKENRIKKYSKLISLMLALVMVFSFMAMSASAATTEVQPRGTCPSCTYGYMENGYGDLLSESKGAWATGCPNIGVGHQHYNHRYAAITLCRNCGYSYQYGTVTRVYCPYNGYVG